MENLEDYYPGYQRSTQLALNKFATIVSDFVNSFIFEHFQNFIMVFGIFANIFHVIILSKKDMRTSSTNIIMIGMAICDIGIMFIFLHDECPKGICIGPLFEMQLALLEKVSESSFRCCCTWLAIMMATTRTIAVKKAMNPRFDVFSKPKCGLFTILLASLLSFLIGCLEYVSNYFHYEYRDKITGARFYYLMTNFKFLPVYLLFSSIFTKFIPCISFPILTILLVVELRKARKQRAKVMNSNGKSRDKGDRTTNLVTYIAVSFMIAELPQGAIKFVESILYNQKSTASGFLFILDNFTRIFLLVGYVNGATHGIICFAMSAKYRENVWSLLRISRNTENKKNMIEMTKSNARSTASVSKITVSN